MDNTELVPQREQVDKVSPNEVAGIMSVIERCALNPQVDVEKMQKLLDMQERILNRNAKQAFSADFVRMKPDLPKIVKTKNNHQTKSKYATLDDINTQVDPILERHGFGTSFKVSQTDTHITATATLWHEQGHTEDATVALPLDKAGIQGSVNKTDVHAIGSSITYAKRYALCALLNISTGDDTDGNGSKKEETATLLQQQKISELVAKLSVELKTRFSKSYPKISEIKKSEVDSVIAKLKNSTGEVANA